MPAPRQSRRSRRRAAVQPPVPTGRRRARPRGRPWHRPRRAHAAAGSGDLLARRHRDHRQVGAAEGQLRAPLPPGRPARARPEPGTARPSHRAGEAGPAQVPQQLLADVAAMAAKSPARATERGRSSRCMDAAEPRRRPGGEGRLAGAGGSASSTVTPASRRPARTAAAGRGRGTPRASARCSAASARPAPGSPGPVRGRTRSSSSSVPSPSPWCSSSMSSATSAPRR